MKAKLNNYMNEKPETDDATVWEAIKNTSIDVAVNITDKQKEKILSYEKPDFEQL